MDVKTRLGIELLAAALVLGLAADALLSAIPWGVNALLWTTLLALAAWGLSYRWRGVLAGPDRWWLLPVGALAASFAWRAAPMLQLATSLALFSLCALAVQRTQATQAEEAGRARPGLVRSSLWAFLGLPAFVWRAVDWSELRSAGRNPVVPGVGRGLALGLPAVAVFGMLLMAADATFEQLVVEILHVDVELLPVRLLRTGFAAVAAAALLRGVLTDVVASRTAGAVVEGGAMQDAMQDGFRLGLTETVVVLGMIDLLFAGFMLVQIPYFFGGAETVVTQEGLTMAAYARRGFFELVMVAALALALLFALHHAFRPAGPAEQRLVRVLSGVQVGLLVLLLASAAQRMWLYQSAYGLTALRLFVSAFLVWLLAVFGWFAWTVLRGRAARFVPGAFVAGLVLVAGLHALNPDALIVRTNVARALEGKPFDAGYAAAASADAVPELLEALPRLRPEHQQRIAAALLERADAWRYADWRTWNYARARALRTLEAQRAYLLRLAPPPAPPPAPPR